jgi:ABC-type uncharacterized transport system substrate-binding protein
MPGVMTQSGSLPIGTVYGGDPVEAKLVASLARPGGNVTVMYLLALDLAGKQLELFKEAVPSLSRVAILVKSAASGRRCGISGVPGCGPTLRPRSTVC